MLPRHSDPIVAIATAPGRGAVGIVRVSGKQIGALVQALCGRALKPREATYLPFRDAAGQAIDQGLAGLWPGQRRVRPLLKRLFGGAAIGGEAQSARIVHEPARR